MDSTQTEGIINRYLAILEQSDKRELWKETELPYSKAVIKQALIQKILTLNKSKSSTRQQLIHAYIGLALFLPADDAQLKFEIRKATSKVSQKILGGEPLISEECQRIAALERPALRIESEIQAEERNLLAEIAALNLGLTITTTENGIQIDFPPDKEPNC